jgi:DNA-binding beta-propeller fold protein YncE
MFTHHSKFKIMATALALLAVPLMAGDKKKAKDSAPEAPKRLAFDITKIVWPNPPAIARIRFQEMYTGEKVDPALLEKPKKPKQSWMDRVAGAKSLAESNAKLPYQYMRVYGVAVDSKGFIYAADQGVDAIFVTNPQSKEVQFIRNDHEAHFGMVNGLAIDDTDKLFVSDSKLHRILVFNPRHEMETAFGSDVLVDPCGIAIDRENRFLYVVDTQRDQVMVFDADTYKLLRTIGTTGKKHTLTEPGDFSLPTHVAVDEEGDVYVTDTLNDRVEIFDADGVFITEFGKIGDGPGHFERPKGIALDSDGHIWVTDAGQQRVKVFDREGHLLIYFGGTGNYPGQFAGIYGITIDKQNRVYVTEQFPGRLQVFQYVTDAQADAEKKKRSADGKQIPSNKATAPAKTSSSVAPLRRDQAWLRKNEAKTDIGPTPRSNHQYQKYLRPKEAIQS